MKPLCMAHWDRPRTDCPDCQRQREVQDALRHGVRQEQIEKYLGEKVAADMASLAMGGGR